MVMDQTLRGLYSSTDDVRPNELTLSGLFNPSIVQDFKDKNTIVNENSITNPPVVPLLVPNNFAPASSSSHEVDSQDDFDFSDVVLKYINQMLMEEDIEDKSCMFQESSALQAAERSFYEVLGEKYPPTLTHGVPSHSDQSNESQDENPALSFGSCDGSSGITDTGNLDDPRCHNDLVEYKSSTHIGSRSNSQSSSSSTNSASYVFEGFVDSPVSTSRVPDTLCDSGSILNFKRGIEEASKLLPTNDYLSADLNSGGFIVEEPKESGRSMAAKVEMKKEYPQDGSRGRKNRLPVDVDMEGGRSNKQTAVYTESTERSEMFDMILLNCQSESALREALQNGTSKNMQQSGQSKASKSGKGRGKKGGKKGVVDLRTILTLCAQSVSNDDRRSANDLLKQIRQHSSPIGDGMQRLAYYFADALEARMAGAGGKHIYNGLISKPTSAADVLKAYHLFLAACPFRKLSNFFSNRTIMNVAEKAPKLHIVDFGILYGFQWPCLIQHLSSRPGGPPYLKITGIDLPQPGFRPAERVEESGRRLENYAKTFNVPFEFNAIAQKWDTIRIEDVKIEKDEVLVVNCMYRLRNLLDETVILDSPRDIVLNLIRKMNPVVFILGIVNGAYSAPFFITRFREALFHYSTLFDMLETNVPREIPQRMLIEKEIFGWEAMNVIACEGSERVERPETYKQCQARILRAGFTQLPLNKEIMKRAKDRVRSCYNKDFLIDEDSPWLLQGWKGRITYALSSWKPAN